MNSSEVNIDYTKKDLPTGFGKAGWVLLSAGLVLVVLSYFMDPVRSAFNNLIMLMLLISIGVGGLFLVALEYIAGAVWSVPFRRIPEFLGAVLFLLPFVALPIYFHMHDMYHWTHIEDVVNDEMLAGKRGYLNIPFFTIRAVVIFVIWMVFYLIIVGKSQKQDKTGDQALTKRNIRWFIFY